MSLVIARAHKVFLACVFSFGILSAFTWSATHVRGQQPESQAVGLDVILLIDNSTSMTGHDPDRLRIKAAKFLMDYLRVNAETMETNYWVGVANFGKEVGDSLSLRLLQGDAVRNWIRDEGLGQTDFRPPLQFARNELQIDFDIGKKMAVILFTDGRPQLTGTPMTEDELLEYFKDEKLTSLVKELQDGGVSLFVLGVGDAQRDQSNWTRLIPRDHYVPITSTAELADVYHRIVAEFIGIAVSKADILPSGREAEFEVEPYLERIVFSFLKSDPTIAIYLTRPDSTSVAPTVGGRGGVNHAIFSVSNPPEGVWKASWEGDGWVRYWVDRQYPTVEVSLQAPYPYTGQPITITAAVIRNGVVLTTPLRLEADIEFPTGTLTRATLSSVDQGKYAGIFAPATKGDYTVTAKVRLQDTLLPVRSQSVTIAILPSPKLPTPIPQLTSALGPTPTATLTPTPSPTLVGSVVKSTATPPSGSGARQPEQMAIGLVLVAVAVLIGARTVPAVQREIRKGRAIRRAKGLLKKPYSVKNEMELISVLDQMERMGYQEIKPVIEALSVRTCTALKQSLEDPLFSRIRARAEIGKRIEQTAFVRALLMHSVETNSLEYVYRYKEILNWLDAFRAAVEAEKLVANGQGNEITALCSAYASVISISDRSQTTTIPEKRQNLEVLRDHLKGFREVTFSAVLHAFYKYICELIEQDWSDYPKPLPENLKQLVDALAHEPETLNALEKALANASGLAERIQAAVTQTAALTHLEEEVLRKWKSGEISCAEYVALDALIAQRRQM